MSNNARVTLACFFAYFVMSGMLAPIGIVLPPLAEYLGEPVAAVAPIFSWLTLGILLGSALALVVFDVLTVRVWILLVYLAIAAALLTLRLSDSALALRLSLGVVGAACGIGLAAAASTITQLYAEDHRASMLVITDGSFSVAGIVISTLAVSLVAAGLHWSTSYLAVAAVAVMVVLLVATARFPDGGSSDTDDGLPAGGAAWPLPVWLCILALFLYTLGQYSLLWWLPTYLEEALGAPREAAGAVVARFWTGMLVTQLLVAWWVLRIGARRLVLLSVSGAFLGSLPLWLNESLTLLPWLSLIWGVANLGLLKIVISFATLAVPNPSPRLVAALLFGATSGTAISPKVTSIIVEAMDTRAVLQFGSLCYLVLGILVFVAWWLMHSRVDTGPSAGK
ncbi:MFS transporter TsgA [Congregibacter variabilis]|uniref:MFS transporter TsgA n=1 Tax=Congregibacter variabilis TaxID=3081200 RepID=A0ABZ0I0N2_9GAMM|nr:MFS transporter TsgA [Congregibacter sp. IMCC43200]